MATKSTGPIISPFSQLGQPNRNVLFSIIDQQIIESSGDNKRKNQPFLMDTVTLEKLFFQTIPLNIDYEPDSQFVSVPIPGRNNPIYQYTGAEDTVEFVLTWYCNDETRQDVLSKCKWIEALTKNDGYDQKPHPVIFAFGLLFSDSKFIVSKAPYRMSNWNREFDMMPLYAEQKIILKKITDKNYQTVDIRRITT